MKEDSVINYEINKVNTQIIDSAGDIKRLSAAVIIDGPYVSEEDAKGNIVQKFVPRSRREMKGFEDIIKKAIGFNETRGDQVNVSNISFSVQEEEESFVESKPGWLDYVKKGSRPVFNILLILLFFLLAIRPFKKWLSQAEEYVGTMSLQQGSGPGSDSQTAELQMKQNSRQQLIDATKQNPNVAADIIKTWINEVR
jgi:flagellar M-ring protein FliF